MIRRRTRFELDKAEARMHIVEGLRRALDVIDEIIRIIRASSSPAAARDALIRWYKRRARIESAERLDWATLRAGTTYTKLQIRDPSSRWASCSSSGGMSFSWRLLLAPEPILAYVVEHEVAHLDVMDHSPRFWKLVERRCPDYRVHERWLRDFGSGLRTII